MMDWQYFRTFGSLISIFLSLFVLRTAALVVYRLYFHPLAKFPGPKVAAATVLYEFYFDALLKGKYTFEIARLHKIYGPVLRISPDEIHIMDPACLDEIYAGSGKIRDRYHFLSNSFGNPDTTFGSVEHHVHREKRRPLNKFFSTAAIARREPEIVDLAQKLTNHISKFQGTNQPVNISDAMSCLTTDVITSYALGANWNFIDQPNFKPNIRAAVIGGVESSMFLKHCPSMIAVMRSIPDAIIGYLMPDMRAFVRFQDEMIKSITKIRAQIAEESPEAMAQGKTIFHALVTADTSPREKSFGRMEQESQVIIGAGTETTGWTLAVITFYVLNNPEIFKRVMAVLESAMPDPKQRPTMAGLTGLPYLNAVIQEGLRLSYGVSCRLQRIDPTGPMLLRLSNGEEVVIPQGKPVGMTSTLMHQNEDIFPKHRVFDPERWLTADGKRDHTLDRFLMNFSRGSRQCLGINLAHAELNIMTAILFRQLGHRMRLAGTAVEDVEIVSDCFLPRPKEDAKDIMVLIE